MSERVVQIGVRASSLYLAFTFRSTDWLPNLHSRQRVSWRRQVETSFANETSSLDDELHLNINEETTIEELAGSVTSQQQSESESPAATDGGDAATAGADIVDDREKTDAGAEPSTDTDDASSVSKQLKQRVKDELAKDDYVTDDDGTVILARLAGTLKGKPDDVRTVLADLATKDGMLTGTEGDYRLL